MAEQKSEFTAEFLSEFTPDELKAIREAASFFENPGMFARSLNWVGRPIESLQNRLPEKARTAITEASKKAIEKALTVSIRTIPTDSDIQSFSQATSTSKRSGLLHTGAAALVGGLGGFLGFLSLPIELPLATILMLRSIANTAQNYGSDLSSLETRLECLYVFSLGSKSPSDDAIDSAYYTSRLVFGEVLKKTTAYIAVTNLREILLAIENGTAPVLVRFIADIAAQFEIRVTKKLFAQTTPFVGAAGGAGINLLFANFFQECARHHFGIKQIEKRRGFEKTRILFEEARRNQKKG